MAGQPRNKGLIKALLRALPPGSLTWPLKMDGWKISFLLGNPIFRGYVKLRGGKGTQWLTSR